MTTTVEAKPIGKVLLEGCRCRCGHEWLKRGEMEPRVCPRCRSPRWDRPRRIEQGRRANDDHNP